MRARRATVIATLALVALGGWWWLGRGDGEAGTDDEVAAVPDDAPAPPVRAGAGDRGEGDRPESLRVLVDDDPAGELRLEGQVIDADELPVSGAVVALGSTPPRTAVTEDDGSFAFDRLVGRDYRLAARADAGVAGPVTATLTATSEPVILRLAPGGTVEAVVVRAEGGDPVAGATVELRGLEIRSERADGDGTARFAQVPPGRYAVVASAAGFAPQHGTLGLRGGGATERVRLELRAGAPVAGRVLDPDGAPVAGARVSYSGASEWSQQADPRLDAAVTDDEGRYRFAALPAGSFRFEARVAGFAPGSSELVTLDGVAGTDGVDIRLEPGASLAGLVVDRAGDPVGGARVRVAARSDGMLWGGARQSFAGDDGRFAIEGLPRKAHEVVATSESAASELHEVDLGRAPHEQEVTLALEVDGRIAGVVVDSAGEPIEGAQVSAFPDFRRGGEMRREMRLRGRHQALSDAGGRFVLAGVADGAYRVRAAPPGSAGRGRGWLTEGVPAEAGDTDVQIVLPKDGRIRGEVALEDGEAPGLFTVSVGWRGGTPFSAEDGRFELDRLPPRDYTVTISGPGFDQTQLSGVTVAEGEEVDLGTITVRRGREIVGVVVDAGGQPVAGALVRGGRYLFGDGSSAAAAGGGGPPMARGAREVTTDDSGSFRLRGIGTGDLSLVAEHDRAGRSRSVRVPGSARSVEGVRLELAPFGALEGTVTRDGQPEENVIVTAASLVDPGATFNVASGPDGSFRFDRLAPDRYKVSAMSGRNPMMGMGFHSQTATVRSGETARVDLSVETGDVSLSVQPVAEDGPVGFVYLMAVQGAIEPASGRELFSAVGAIGEGASYQAISFAGRPGTLQQILPGTYTVCGVPYPREVEGMSSTMDYMEREGDELPVFCEEVAVAAAPAKQSVSLPVEVPAFVPPPAPPT